MPAASPSPRRRRRRVRARHRRRLRPRLRRRRVAGRRDRRHDRSDDRRQRRHRGSHCRVGDGQLLARRYASLDHQHPGDHQLVRVACRRGRRDQQRHHLARHCRGRQQREDHRARHQRDRRQQGCEAVARRSTAARSRRTSWGRPAAWSAARTPQANTELDLITLIDIGADAELTLAGQSWAPGEVLAVDPQRHLSSATRSRWRPAGSSAPAPAPIPS